MNFALNIARLKCGEYILNEESVDFALDIWEQTFINKKGLKSVKNVFKNLKSKTEQVINTDSNNTINISLLTDNELEEIDAWLMNTYSITFTILLEIEYLKYEKYFDRFKNVLFHLKKNMKPLQNELDEIYNLMNISNLNKNVENKDIFEFITFWKIISEINERFIEKYWILNYKTHEDMLSNMSVGVLIDLSNNYDDLDYSENVIDYWLTCWSGFIDIEEFKNMNELYLQKFIEKVIPEDYHKLFIRLIMELFEKNKLHVNSTIRKKVKTLALFISQEYPDLMIIRTGKSDTDDNNDALIQNPEIQKLDKLYSKIKGSPNKRTDQYIFSSDEIFILFTLLQRKSYIRKIIDSEITNEDLYLIISLLTGFSHKQFPKKNTELSIEKDNTPSLIKKLKKFTELIEIDYITTNQKKAEN